MTPRAAVPVDEVRHGEVVVVGTGVAGLAAALGVSPRSVTVLTKSRLGEGGSSAWAQGGVAAAVGDDDDPRLHAADTLAVSGGLGDPEIVALLTREGPLRIDDLIALGTRFDRAPTPEPPAPLALGREAAHSRRRILHAGGDATGAELVRALTAAVRRAPGVTVVEETFALDLAVEAMPDGRPRRVVGVLAEDRHGRRTLHLAGAVVLATGGLGQLYRHTTNPAEVTGDGLAMAARAGAGLVDLEFVQFHPTALAAGGVNADGALPLLTEALRGEGAVLVDGAGRRFMVDEHPDAELAPRDVVARAIHRRREAGEEVFLDARRAVGERFPRRFPTVFETAMAAGIDPRRDLLPVTPAAHYHMGGVEVDDRGRSTLPGLWACGEAACTGAHGANRLASNSLLEALVFGARVADDVTGRLAPLPGGGAGYLRRLRVAGQAVAATDASPDRGAGSLRSPESRSPRSLEDPTQPASRRARSGSSSIRSTLRRLLTTHAGLERTATGLRTALAEIDALAVALPATPAPGADRFHHHETRNLLLAARLLVTAALARPESRGAHFRLDRRLEDPAWRRRLRVALDGEGAVEVTGAPAATPAAVPARRASR